jgi:hypothetical protein
MTITVRIPDEIWEEVKQSRADKPYLSKNAIIVALLMAGLKKEKE